VRAPWLKFVPKTSGMVIRVRLQKMYLLTSARPKGHTIVFNSLPSSTLLANLPRQTFFRLKSRICRGSEYVCMTSESGGCLQPCIISRRVSG
jgi:hypothetical protein